MTQSKFDFGKSVKQGLDHLTAARPLEIRIGLIGDGWQHPVPKGPEAEKLAEAIDRHVVHENGSFGQALERVFEIAQRELNYRRTMTEIPQDTDSNYARPTREAVLQLTP